MTFRPANCPSCGGSLQLPDDQEAVMCMYCGSRINVKEVLTVRISANLDNLFLLAHTALKSGNHKEAYKYYSTILEHDATSPEAWFGKGVAAGWTSTHDIPNLTEMTECFSTSLDNAKENEKQHYSQKMSNEINTICNFAHSISLDQFQDSIGEPVSLAAAALRDHKENCEIILLTLEEAYTLQPINAECLITIINICHSLITLKIGLLAMQINKADKRFISSIMDRAVFELKKIDPNYRAPKIKKLPSSCSGCLIMGLFCLLFLVSCTMLISASNKDKTSEQQLPRADSDPANPHAPSTTSQVSENREKLSRTHSDPAKPQAPDSKPAKLETAQVPKAATQLPLAVKQSLLKEPEFYIDDKEQQKARKTTPKPQTAATHSTVVSDTAAQHKSRVTATNKQHSKHNNGVVLSQYAEGPLPLPLLRGLVALKNELTAVEAAPALAGLSRQEIHRLWGMPDSTKQGTKYLMEIYSECVKDKDSNTPVKHVNLMWQGSRLTYMEVKSQLLIDVTDSKNLKVAEAASRQRILKGLSVHEHIWVKPTFERIVGRLVKKSGFSIAIQSADGNMQFMRLNELSPEKKEYVDRFPKTTK